MVGGGFSTILRADTAPLLFYGVLGAKAAALKDPAWAASTVKALGAHINAGAGPYDFEATTAGTTGTTEPVWPTAEGATVTDGTVVWTNRGLARRSHTVTPASDQPWFTLWRFWSRNVAERFTDCKLVSLQVTGGADQNVGDLIGQFGAVGKSYEYLTTLAYDPYDPADASAGTLDDSEELRWFGYDITVDGAADANVDQFTHELNANQETARTNTLAYSRIEPGQRSGTLTYQKIYTSDAEYRRAAYGSATATSPTDAVSVAAWHGGFKDASGIERMTMDVPALGYTEDPDLPFNSGGEIARVGFGGGIQRPASGSVVTYAFTNQIASYPLAS